MDIDRQNIYEAWTGCCRAISVIDHHDPEWTLEDLRDEVESIKEHIEKAGYKLEKGDATLGLRKALGENLLE